MKHHPDLQEGVLNGSDRLKILVLSPWGLSGGYSGPIVLLNRLFSAIADKHDAEIHVAHRDRGIDRKPEWVEANYPLVKSSPEVFTPLQKIRWVIAARSLLKRRSGEYDVIHLHGTYLLNVIPLLGLGARSKIVLLPVLDGGDLTTARGAVARFIKTALFRHVLRRALGGFSLALGIRCDLERLGLPAARIHEMPNIVDTNDFVPSLASGQFAETPFVLGFVGKMGETKRPHLILEALALLREEGRNVRGLFVGPFASDGYASEFRSLEEKYDLTREVDVVGFQAVTSTFFQMMDAFVLPSKAEGMPGAVVEAMSSGLPVVVTDVGSMKSVVNDSDAGFVVEGTAESISEAVRNLMDESSQRAAMATAAREYACEHFSNNAVAATYVQAVKRHSSKVFSK